MSMIPARSFGLEVRPDLPENVIDAMLRNFRESWPTLMRKNMRGHWCFYSGRQKSVESYLRDPENVAKAKQDAQAMMAYGAGKAAGKRAASGQGMSRGKEFCLRVKHADGTFVDLSAQAVEEFLYDVCNQHEALAKGLQGLVNIYASENPGFVGYNVPGFGRFTPTATVADSNVVQLPVRTESVPNAASGGFVVLHPDHKKLTVRDAARRVGLFLATRPDLLVSQTDRAWFEAASEIRAVGLRTATGKSWTFGNLKNNKKEILQARDECLSIWGGGKPRIRIRQEGKASGGLKDAVAERRAA